MPAPVRTRGLTKRYGQLVAVDHVSLEVREGEIFGVLGPNGAGKTTLLEMLEGLRRPDGGQIEVLGIDVGRQPRRVRQLIGIQLQDSAFFDRLTVGETLELFAALYPRARPPAELLAELALEEKAGALVMNLSGGQRQRLALASALVNDPALLFLDEPTTGLDPQARRSVWALIERIRARGKTIILTTHYMEEAQSLCDRVAIMDHGRILALDAPLTLIRGLGAESAIEFETAGPLEAAALAGLAAVREARPLEDGRRWLLFTDRPQATLLALTQDFPGLEGLYLRQPTLEDVFLHYTGHGLRD